MTKRNYDKNLQFVEDGFRACWANANNLVAGAKALLDAGLHAQALSSSVLAIEELGKMFCLDGLLFARSYDEKAKAFANSLRSHSGKLLAFEFFPLLVGQIASVDPRHGSAAFGQAVAISMVDLKKRGHWVLSMLEGHGFGGLDSWKQAGFYAQPNKMNHFVKPNDAVAPDFSQAVYMLAWRAVSTLDFMLKGGNLERHITRARDIRLKLNEADHLQIEQAAEQVCAELLHEQGKKE